MQVVVNPRTDRIRKIVLESGDRYLGNGASTSATSAQTSGAPSARIPAR